MGCSEYDCFNKIYNLFVLKKPRKLGIKGNFFILINGFCDQPALTSYVIVPLSLGFTHRCLPFPFLFNIVSEDLASIISEEKEIKCIQIGMEEVKKLPYSEILF
jgi:hypothetical protein